MLKKPLLPMIGKLLTRGKDWNNAEFGALFQRLADEVSKQSSVTRYLRYYGETEKGTEVRFFGVQTESIVSIPEGLTALGCTENSFSVYKPGAQDAVPVWQSRLDWDWLDTSNASFPTGEFITLVPENWLKEHSSEKVRFKLTGNTYSVKDTVINDDVQLVAYNPAWQEQFHKMKAFMQERIPGDICTRYEHYGSTAIPDMPAKPVIDILIEVTSFRKARKYLLPLFNSHEYEYWWYNDHMVFVVRNSSGARTHHIHAAPAGNAVWDGLIFRDHLRSHPDDAAQYSELKKNLTKSHKKDRETYTEAKADFVRKIVEKAGKPAV